MRRGAFEQDGGVRDVPLLRAAVEFLSLRPFQTGSRGSPPPVGTVPLFNPAQVSQVRASSRGAAGQGVGRLLGWGGLKDASPGLVCI